jgi:D-3-phosphoglycerate dehydrogenase / 2-oxoglutarate reductase
MRWATATWSKASPVWPNSSPKRKTETSDGGGSKETTAVARVLVTEKIAQSGLDLLSRAGHEVDIAEGLSPEQLLETVVGAQALIIRSATQVTAEVLAAGTSLVVVGRAGVGLDNVDVAAATERGVMVVNAPTSNILSVAEQAMALLLAQARNIPQAHSALVAGRWERSKWEGVELHGKVLGVVGLGRAGSLVAQRAHAFGMELIGYDPFVSQDRARAMGVRLVSIEELVAEADFVSIHTPKTPETIGLFGRDLLAKAKPGIRIVNTARGGIVDEEALADAIRDGIVAGAGLDVFAREPCTESPLFELPQVVVSPHLGASTEEAQDKAGVTIAEMVLLALDGDFVPYAVNVAARDVSDAVRAFLGLSEQLGRFFVGLHDGLPDSLEIEYEGDLAGENTGILTLSALKGIFGGSTEEPVSYVNAPQLAEQRGLAVRESSTSTSPDYKSLITLRSNSHAVAGTLITAGVRTEPRIVMVDEHVVEVPPSEHMLVVRNDDRPGVIGVVGTALGLADVSISSMAVGPSPGTATAMMVISTASLAPDVVVEQLRGDDGILDIHRVTL